MKIALVAPESSGGVGVATYKLHRGLLLDGFNVKIIMLPSSNMPTVMYSDISHCRYLEEFDAVIYMGSIAWPSHIFLKKPKKGLFLHGFVHSELINNVRYLNARTRIMSSLLLVYWHSVKFFHSMDFYICRSRTSCEVNNISNNCVILPQFVLPEEIEFCNQLLKLYAKSSHNTTRIVTYTSSVISPRLLHYEHILLLSKKLRDLCKRKFEIIVVDPMKRVKSTDFIRVINPMPRSKLLRLLSASDLYLEGNLDDELRNTSLEAGLLGVPVAKITCPAYMDRQDYNEQLITATSIKELAVKIAKYVNDLEYYKPYYSHQIREFVIGKRQWNKVKGPLIKKLREIMDEKD